MIAAKYKILHPKYLVLIFFIMLGLSFASVPLYDLFCRVTGFGGTPQVTKKLPTIVANQLVTMRFDANAAGNLPVRFQVKNNKIDLRPGEIKNVIFQVSNEVNQDLKVVATFNVTPDSVGKYFNKLDFHQYLNLCRQRIVFEQEDISLKLVKLIKFMVILQKAKSGF